MANVSPGRGAKISAANRSSSIAAVVAIWAEVAVVGQPQANQIAGDLVGQKPAHATFRAGWIAGFGPRTPQGPLGSFHRVSQRGFRNLSHLHPPFAGCSARTPYITT